MENNDYKCRQTDNQKVENSDGEQNSRVKMSSTSISWVLKLCEKVIKK